MPSRILHLACAQLGPIQKADDRASVVVRLCDLLRDAAGRGATFVVFPEMALTTFFPRWVMDDPDEIDSYFETEMPSAVTQPLFDLAADLKVGFYLGYAERVHEADVTRHFNTSIMVDRAGRIVGTYRKIHLPGTADPIPGRESHHLEKRYFEPGNLGFNVFDMEFGKAGMCICNDRRWPETWRMLSLQGAEIGFVGYNTPDDHTGNFDFDRLTGFHNALSLQASAYQNAMWIGATAKAGIEEGSRLIGDSMIVAPSGEIAVKASTTEDEVISYACDLDMSAIYRRTMFDFARHREPDHYGLITSTRGIVGQ